MQPARKEDLEDAAPVETAREAAAPTAERELPALTVLAEMTQEGATHPTREEDLEVTALAELALKEATLTATTAIAKEELPALTDLAGMAHCLSLKCNYTPGPGTTAPLRWL